MNACQALVNSSGPENAAEAVYSPRCGSREKKPSKPSLAQRPDGLDDLAVARTGDHDRRVGRAARP